MADSVSERVLWADGLSRSWLLELTFQVIDGRVACTGMRIDPESGKQPISATLLREIPLSALIDQVLEEPSPELLNLAGLQSINELRSLAEHGLGLLRERPGKHLQPKSGRPPIYGPDHYATVSRIYQMTPRRPTEAVASHFGVPRSRAANWVRRARQLGLITDFRPSPQQEAREDHEH